MHPSRHPRITAGILAIVLGAGMVPIAAGRSNPATGCARGEHGLAARTLGPAGDYPAEVAASWFAQIGELVREVGLAPPAAARAYGVAGVALYEALRPGMPGRRSLAGQLNDLARVPVAPETGSLHWPSVANAALARVAHAITARRTDLAPRTDDLERYFRDRALTEVARRTHAASAAHGRAVAAAILDWAEQDGSRDLARCDYRPPAVEGGWVPTPPAYATAVEPCWGRLRPFAIASPDACPVEPPEFSAERGSAFDAETREVWRASRELTPEQRTMAWYWADGPGTPSPAGHWIAILTQILVEDGASLDRAAEAYAAVGIAAADAMIACWHAKYEAAFVRPITVIRARLDPGWEPLVATPPFPEFTSGHSVLSGAVATVLAEIVGERAFVDRTHVARGLAPRAYHTPEAAALEAAISRLYGGIHFRTAIERGLEQGLCVGRSVLDRVRFTE